MNKIIIGLMVLMLIPIVYAIDDNCKGTMDENDIPCLLLLTVNQSVTPCNTLTTLVFDNGSTLAYRQAMHQYNSFKCNNTFNQTAFGTYTILYETGDTGTIVIEEDEFQQYYLYLAVILVFFILVILGYIKGIGEFTMIAGMLAMIIGVNVFTNSFPNLTNDFLRNSITVIIWGVGAYLIIAPAAELFEKWKEKE